MAVKKILFVDRDGTLIREPEDQQIDSLSKFELVDRVIPALLKLKENGFRFVMVTNQDGLGTNRYPQAAFDSVQEKLLQVFGSQGIAFDEVLVCPHFSTENCLCRKPHLGLVRKYLTQGNLDLERSAVIGDRETDLLLAQNMGIQGFRLGRWEEIAREISAKPRRGHAFRQTRETKIQVELELDSPRPSVIRTGIGFFDHMLEQLTKHGGFSMDLVVEGDLHVDAHHTIEDTALALGQALRIALGDKFGIGRYGFVLPMDEAKAEVALDLGGRAYFVLRGSFPSSHAGELPTEMVPHFFRSLADELGATLHIRIDGENTHHMVEAIFKAFARALRMAMTFTQGQQIPSTKGML